MPFCPVPAVRRVIRIGVSEDLDETQSPPVYMMSGRLLGKLANGRCANLLHHQSVLATGRRQEVRRILIGNLATHDVIHRFSNRVL